MVKRKYLQWTYQDGAGVTKKEKREIRSYTKDGKRCEGVFLGRVGNGNLKMFKRIDSIEKAREICNLITPFPSDVEIIEKGD